MITIFVFLCKIIVDINNFHHYHIEDMINTIPINKYITLSCNFEFIIYNK